MAAWPQHSCKPPAADFMATGDFVKLGGNKDKNPLNFANEYKQCH